VTYKEDPQLEPGWAVNLAYAQEQQ
jgi:hypothetical protein